MIDSYFRSPYQKYLISPLLNVKVLNVLPPVLVTFFGLLIGLTIPLFLLADLPLCAACALLLSGFLDTLDGSLARYQNASSDRGAVLDIVSDRMVEGSVILGLYLYAPEHALGCLGMLVAILVCVTSFLVVGIFSEKRPGEKSFYYSPGIVERAEAFGFFFFLILFPHLFPVLSLLFVFLVLLTALVRVYQFML